MREAAQVTSAPSGVAYAPTTACSPSVVTGEMATPNDALERPAGTTTHTLVRVQEAGARFTSTGPVLPAARVIVTTPVTFEPARTGSGRARELTAAVVVV